MQSVEKIFEKLDAIRNLPTLPLVMQKISAAVRDPKSDARTVASLIEDDPAIMARVLKVVNSALYSGSVTIDSVQQAVARMGMTAVNNLALSTSVFSAFGKGDDDGFDRESFWRHSISVGIAACVIHDRAAPQLNQRYGKEALRLVGLLHDMGKIVLAQYFNDDFSVALRQANDRKTCLFEMEREVVGADHGRIGGWLGVKWSLNNDLIQAVRWHHEPDSPNADQYWELVAICHVANYICNQQRIGDGGDLAAPTLTQSVWKRIGLSVGDISEIVDEVNEESKKSDILLALE